MKTLNRARGEGSLDQAIPQPKKSRAVAPTLPAAPAKPANISLVFLDSNGRRICRCSLPRPAYAAMGQAASRLRMTIPEFVKQVIRAGVAVCKWDSRPQPTQIRALPRKGGAQ